MSHGSVIWMRELREMVNWQALCMEEERYKREGIEFFLLEMFTLYY